MATIVIEIIDTMGNSTLLPVPNDKPVAELLPSIITLAQLSATDEQGRSLNYRMFGRRLLRVLQNNESLLMNGILEGDQLRIAPSPFDTYLEFEMLTEPDKGKRLSLPARSRIMIGRGSENDVVIRSEIVSRQHGELIWQDGLHIYRDLNSANSSYINDLPVVEPMPLSINSVLSLGETVRLLYRETAREVASTSATAGKPGITEVRTNLNPLPRAGVFMSYAVEDSQIVDALADSLRKARLQPFGVDEIALGSNVEEAIKKNLAYSDVMVVLLTINTLSATNQMDYWNQYVLERKPIIVVQYDTTDIPLMLQGYPRIVYKGNLNQLIQELISAVASALR